MPLYEFECIKCRKEVNDSLKQIEQSVNKKKVSDLVKKYKNINHMVVFDLENEEALAEHGKRDKEATDLDFYINEGSVVVFFNLQRNYRFSELIYEKGDEEKLKCLFCGSKKVEKVFSGFAFTSDLCTDMPKPDLSGLPPSVRKKTALGAYIEEKDRPKKNK